MTATTSAPAQGVSVPAPRDLLLNRIQKDIPIVQRPYAVIGEEVGLSEAEALAILREVKEAGVLRQVSAIFDTRTLGYQSSLVAAVHDADQLDEGAALVSQHPGVSHNYRRNHDFNLWYTIAVPPESDLEAHVQRLHELSGAKLTRLMPTLHLYKIGVEFDMTGKEAWNAKSLPQYTSAQRNIGYAVSDTDKRFVVEFQKDLPVTEEPYAEACAALGMSIQEVAAHAEKMKAAGALTARQRGVQAPVGGLYLQRDGRVGRAAGTGGRSRAAVWPVQGGVALLPAPHLSGVALHHLLWCTGAARKRPSARFRRFTTRWRPSTRHLCTPPKNIRRVRLEFYKPEFYEWEEQHLNAAGR